MRTRVSVASPPLDQFNLDNVYCQQLEGLEMSVAQLRDMSGPDINRLLRHLAYRQDYIQLPAPSTTCRVPRLGEECHHEHSANRRPVRGALQLEQGISRPRRALVAFDEDPKKTMKSLPFKALP